MTIKTYRLRVCGLSRFGDILAANDILSGYIGFISVENGHKATPDKAAQLRQELGKRIKAVDALINALMEEIAKLSEDRGNAGVTDLTQLHGDEDKAYIKQLKTYAGLPVIKTIQVRSRERILRAQELPCDYLLLGTYTKSRYGGGDTQFGWNMIPELTKPYFLAGGIHLGDVRQAVSHGPHCIDVGSAMETEDRKDRRKVEEMAQVLW